MTGYEPFETETFSKRLKKVKHPPTIQDIKDSIKNKLLPNPTHNTEHLQGILKGKRKFRSGDFRIIFTICEECKKFGHQKHNGCEGCDHPDNQIMLWDVMPRKEDYK